MSDSTPGTKVPVQKSRKALRLLERAIQNQKMAPINLAAIKRPKPRYTWETPIGLSIKGKIDVGML